MDASSETQGQILQMTQFILNEAKDRAEEITTKALQEFSTEKLKAMNEMKDKIRGEYEKKRKTAETQAAIARSSAINKARLQKITARQEVIQRICEDTKTKLIAELKTEAKAKAFITDLIVQGMLMLLEEEVEVRCRTCDDALVQSCLAAAAKKYSEVIKKETGSSKESKLTLDKVVKLPAAPTAGGHGASCLGGVALACQSGSISIDNTIDSRLHLVLEQAKPKIRQLLFTK